MTEVPNGLNDVERARQEAREAGLIHYDEKSTISSLEQIEVPAKHDGSGGMVPAVRICFATGETEILFKARLNEDGGVSWGKPTYKVGDAVQLIRNTRDNEISGWGHWVR
jgi:hypothetical protein